MKKDTLKGQVIAITGTLISVRKSYIDFIRAMGGEYVRTMNKRVTLLVEGDTDYTTEKQRIAFLTDIPTTNESGLFAIAEMTLKQYNDFVRQGA